jgi:hypothetical protein
VKRFAILIALALWAFLLWRGLDAFGPGSDINNLGFNSDSAIPVLMANDERRITVFNCYYWLGTNTRGRAYIRLRAHHQ